ncbi:hypothetical protein [Micromonospora sp. 4G55]|nr:hypothetical protein [Micromonospora sp. 4G55]MBM0255989.1 hypothetical protein [Micromonospora sp. 4G55]
MTSIGQRQRREWQRGSHGVTGSRGATVGLWLIGGVEMQSLVSFVTPCQ